MDLSAIRMGVDPMVERGIREAIENRDKEIRDLKKVIDKDISKKVIDELVRLELVKKNIVERVMKLVLNQKESKTACPECGKDDLFKNLGNNMVRCCSCKATFERRSSGR